MKTVCVVGLGYIGLPTAAILAESGWNVIGVDVNSRVCETINKGEIHIVEPGLDLVVELAVLSERLKAGLSPSYADAYIIAVPTPFNEDMSPDVSYVKAACDAIAPYLKRGNVVILESTSPVGTTDQVSSWLSDKRPDLHFPLTSQTPDVHIAYCPERVLPGKVMVELIANDRLVGGLTPECSKKACAVYESFVQGLCIITNARTAEMAKLTENSFRDVNIAFANELSMICNDLDINVWELIQLANRHPRVKILQPGCGVGGHCIAVDPWFIVHQSPHHAKLIKTARQVNDHKPMWVAEQVKARVTQFLMSNPNRTLSSIRIGIYGLSFKPNIDDFRESPALNVVKHLNEVLSNVSMMVFEPHLTSITQLPKGSPAVSVATLSDIKKADIHVVLVAHDAFKELAHLDTSATMNFSWG